MEEQKKKSRDTKMYEERNKKMLFQTPKKFWATGQAKTKMYN